MRYLLLVFIVGITAYVQTAVCGSIVVAEGERISFNYELTVDNKVIDSTEGRVPFNYVHGQTKLVPGLVRQLKGLEVGDEKIIIVPPEEGYGKVNPKYFREINKSKLPKDKEINAGSILYMNTGNKQGVPVRVIKIKGDSVFLDFNHVLAGKILVYKVKIVSIGGVDNSKRETIKSLLDNIIKVND